MLTHFPLLDDDKGGSSARRKPDPRVKGGDGSGPFRILSLANSADAEATLTLAKRVYLAGSPFINLAVFEPHAVKYDSRCESDGRMSHISEDKSQQKKRARGHQPPPERDFNPLRFAKVTTAITSCPLPASGTTRTCEFSSGKFVDYSCGACDAFCRIVNSLNKYVSQFAANVFSTFFFFISNFFQTFRTALD